MPSRIKPPSLLDPFSRNFSDLQNAVYRTVSNKTPRSLSINPVQKTLVLISAGQSLSTNISPTAYTIANPTKMDAFDALTGNNYVADQPALNTNFPNAAPFGPGLIAYRIADRYLTAGKFDRVIVVPIGIGGTAISQWTGDGELSSRLPNAVAMLAARGVTPTTTGVTMCILWMQGESEYTTTQADYQTAWGLLKGSVDAVGFTGGRYFICRETWNAGVTRSVIQAAQVAVVDNVTVFSGGNMDSLDATNRVADNTHPNDTGAAAAGLLIYNAMSASGAPY